MFKYAASKCRWAGAMGLGAIVVSVALPADAAAPTTAPTTAPASAADEPSTRPSSPFAGGGSIGPYDRPRPQADKPAFVSPMEGVSSGSGDKPAEVQIGAGVGPSQGQYKPNASVTTGPVTNLPRSPDRPADRAK